VTPSSHENAWPNWKKIGLRFTVLFFGSTTIICWEEIVFFTTQGSSDHEPFAPEALYKPLIKPFYWLDKTIFHTGYNPGTHISLPADNHFGVVFYLSILLFSVLGTLLWSFLDRKRRSCGRLYFWFTLYIRYILAIIIFGYGIDKLIPVQMRYPGAVDLLTPLGEQGRFSILWNFMGVSPGFMIFAGACEIIGSALLFSRRTMVFGALFTCTILSNVVAFNWFYNIPVKLFSTQLLLYDVYLLVPYVPGLWAFFLRGNPAVLETRNYTFQTPWKRRTLGYKLVLIPLVINVLTTAGVYFRYLELKAEQRRSRIYEVTSFVARDSLQPLLTDTLRWKRVVFDYRDYIIIYDMRDQKDWYHCDVDSNRKTFTLHDNPDTSTWKKFSFEYPPGDQLVLKGKWKGQEVTIRMRSVPLESLQLNKEKISVVQD
jgi:hypothetical protein